MDAVRAVVPSERTLEFESFTLPDEPPLGQALVRIERTIISAGTELANFTGLDPGVRIEGSWNCYPWRPGYGGVGSVIAAGDGATVKAGQRVYGIFNHASHALVDTRRELCVPVPPELDPSVAVFVRMGNVAITASQRSLAGSGDEVAIVGLGVVGNLAGQFFLAAGQRVVGVDLSSRRRQAALLSGFEAVLDPAEQEDLGAALESALGRRPRAVVDAVGDSRVVAGALHAVGRNGEVILLGTPRAPWETDATALFNLAHRNGVSIIGALEWNIPLLKRLGPEPTTEGNAERILAMLAEETLRILPLRSKVAPPGELLACYEGLLERKDEYLGVVLDWDDASTAVPGGP